MTRTETIADGVTIHLGDCLDVLPTLAKADAVVTSPPYNLGDAPWPHLGNWKQGDSAGGKSKWKNGSDAATGIQYGTHSDAMPWPSYVAWQHKVISALWHGITDKGCIFYNHKPRVIGARLWLPTELLPPHVTLRQVVIWARPGGLNFNPTAYVPTHEWIMLIAKPDFRLKSKAASGLGDVWRMSPDTNEHPAPFPVALPTNAIETTDAETILDPFMGSGSTGIAAMRLGRRFVGIEIDPKYFDLACRRLSEAAKQQDFFIEKPKPATQAQLI